ncbi:MAG: tetratricopeptide repeat protein, partial [Bacillota bacterium]
MGLELLKDRLAKLWQLPLLLLSLALFGYAAYLFIDPQAGPSAAQQIEIARVLLKQDRAEAAIKHLNTLLEKGNLKPEVEGGIRVVLGEALEQAQKQKGLNLAVNHVQIIEQTKRGISMGIVADAPVHRRLGESYEALGRARDAVAHYQKAAGLDSAHGQKWQRKVIDLELSQEDYDAATTSIDEYLKRSDLADGERAWAMGEKAHILIDRGQFQEAKRILADALRLSEKEGGNPGVFGYWLGYSEWKLGNVAEAERLMRAARDVLRVQHPLDGDAAYSLGRLKQEQKEYAVANSYYAAVLQSHLDSRVAPSAKLNRGICRIALGEHEPGLSDLSDLTRLVKEKQLLPPRLRGEVIAGLQEAMQLLSAQGNYQGALEVLAYEQELQSEPGADFFERLGRLYERRAAQLEGGIGEVMAQDKARREQQARECRAKAGDAYTAVARLLVVQDDKGHGEALWKAVEQYERSADLSRVTAALETFVGERPDDSRAPDALLKLGQSYQAAGLFDKAIEAYRRNQF